MNINNLKSGVLPIYKDPIKINITYIRTKIGKILTQ